MKTLLTMTQLLCVALLLVAGCKKDDTVTGPVPIDIHGFVKDYYGQAYPNAIVKIGSAITSSDANGQFTIRGITPPYDISVIMTTYNLAVTYQGVTRPDPRLLYFGVLNSYHSATLSGSIPAVDNRTTMIAFVYGNRVNYYRAGPNTSSYSMTMYWYGPSTVSGKLYLLRWAPDANGFPLVYDGWGSQALSVSDGGSYTTNFAAGDLTDPDEATISGSVSAPANSTLSYREFFVTLDSAQIYIAEEYPNPPMNFSYTVPKVNVQKASVIVGGYLPPDTTYSYHWKTGISDGATGVTVPLNKGPRVLLPAGNASNIDVNTDFSWTPGTGTGMHFIYFYPVSGSGPQFYVYTSKSTATIPDFSHQGMSLPGNTLYYWSVYQYSGLLSSDYLTSETWLKSQVGSPLLEYGVAGSKTAGFTTKP